VRCPVVSESSVLCLGETLWDVLPDGEYLGGAPLNVAAHLTRLGTRAVLVSRVGADARGRTALAEMRALGLDTARVQIDPWLPTGEARASIDASGSATYFFLQPAAWDRIEADAATLRAADEAAAVVFGTLVQRTPAGAAVVRQILDNTHLRVLDLNLRAPHVDREVALASLSRADFVKLNEDELKVLADWLGIGATAEALQSALAERFDTSSLCITLGAEGALLWHEGRWVRQRAYRVEVADTIGAGDSFLAMLLAELFAERSAEVAMERAARLAAFVASQRGAVPSYDASTFRS
jgi:fructokinase